MTSALLARRFVSDHLRNPVNLFVLVAVPVAFVLVAAGPLAEAGETLGTGGVSIDSITAGWAAGFIAGVGMYFQVSAARFSDRRLVIAGLPRATLVTGRLVSGGMLAGLASGSALAALAIRTGLD
ncbi:ABC transporter permease, partial [Actinotalea sp. AC32]|nr:ABC transporter permease [Actinotalea sp. AC32]